MLEFCMLLRSCCRCIICCSICCWFCIWGFCPFIMPAFCIACNCCCWWMRCRCCWAAICAAIIGLFILGPIFWWPMSILWAAWGLLAIMLGGGLACVILGVGIGRLIGVP